MATVNASGEAINPQAGHTFYTIKETPEPVHAVIKGEIPSWLNGSMLRNGPGKFELGDQQMNHLFDGLSVMHRFNIQDGKVTYQSRFQRSDAYVLGMKEKRLVLSEFGTAAYPDPCLNIFQRIMARFTPSKRTDNYNINWVQIGDEFFVCSEAQAVVRKVDPETLETLHKVPMTDTIALNTATAHPHTTADGTVYNMGSTYGRNTRYNIVKIPPRRPGETGNPFQNMSLSASISPSLHKMYPSYYHSFGITENYFVFVEQPLIINLFKLLRAHISSYVGLPPGMSFLEFHPEMQTKFHLIRRDNGEILPIEYEAESFFSFHHINAYEEAGHVVVDLVCFTDVDILHKTYMQGFRSGILPATKAEPRRYSLPLDIKKKELKSDLNGLMHSKAKNNLKSSKINCTYDLISDQAIVVPQINYKLCNGKPYQYFYGIAGKDSATLVKCDTKSCSSLEWYENSCFPSEPEFVGRPGATNEDDGVILSSVIDVREGHDPFLLILDAKDFHEIGRADVPAELSNSFHGMFVPRN